jgi:hypothetical protein
MLVVRTATFTLLLILLFGGAAFVRDKMLLRGGLLMAGCALALAGMSGLLG